jgi:hypothetical protein
MRHKGIREIFTKYGKFDFEVWLSGRQGFGRVMSWHSNGQQFEDMTVSKDGKFVSERKVWAVNGELIRHEVFDDNGNLIRKVV